MTATNTETRTATINGVPVAEHSCDGFDCELCVGVERDAAGARLEAYRAKKFGKPDATSMLRGAVMTAGSPVELLNIAASMAEEERVTSLQQTLSDGAGPYVAPPAHLGTATVAKGFILAGNATFTVRSQKTGVRYTYKVTRADCSRCGRTDCQCWAHPTYFVALLTGPDNTGDYTYLGMLRDGGFRLTRGSKMKADSKPVLAFGWVWAALAAGCYPAQVEIWHEGKCGRCGRPLTVPESIANGIGPVCAEKGGL